MTFKDWADGCEFRLQRLAREIEAAGNSARQIRTSAVKFDQANTARKPTTLSETLGTLIELVEVAKTSAACAMLDNAFRSQLDGVETHLRAMLKGASENTASDKSEESPRPRRKPPLLQKGARHFASLAGVFQLQDCFDQRVDHISTGTALASSSSVESQPLMLQVINAQVAGIATTTSDFTAQASEATDSLKSMHEASLQDVISGDSLSEEEAKKFVEHVLGPLNALISRLCSQHPDVGPGRKPDHDMPEADLSCGNGQLDDDPKQETLVLVNRFEDCFDAIYAQHPRVADQVTDRTISGVSKTYDDLNVCIASLRESADDLMEFTGDLMASEQEPSQLAPDASGLLESLVNSFTMDSEREDHRSALHRLGLAT